ncbi:MAG: bifunctional anthranilate synthase component I family protein/class IV aminotransferase [Actinomycetota bacterium]|nr:bifunctional anthranilate synthase component I family protein/class IV aminotransferase [Actinomycetota bacterium]
MLLSGASHEFVAREPERVASVLRAAEDAARQGRWVAGFVSYEAAHALDAALPALGWPPEHPLSGLPLAWFAGFARREEVDPPQLVPGHGGVDWRLDRDRAWHRGAVTTVREAIAAGDYYELNLTARLTAALDDPLELYRRLAGTQPGAYSSLIVTGEHTVVSASPELFFVRKGDEVLTRPMKGTARRGRWPNEDLASARALRTSEKERAENVMIVDVMRNDLGKVAEVGSVTVPALFETERYPTLWQLTSTVTARVGPDTDLADLFAALFPSGSVTGAPKRAAMQAIASTEQRPRGVYCGAVGYLSPDPRRPAARFAVAIRTATHANISGYAEYGAGGAITWSSDADAEWAELETKALALTSPPRPARLIETLRLEPPQTLVNLDRHLARLCASAEYFDFHYEQAAVDAALAHALAHRRAVTRVRIVLARSGAVHVEAEDLAPTAALVRLGVADRPIRSDDVLLFHKQADRDLYDSLRRSQPEVDDVVLWNERRQVTETTTASLAVQLDGRWWTPSLAGGLLPGVERARLIDLGALTERDISIDELTHADGVAVVNSLRGWRGAELSPVPSRAQTAELLPRE